MGSGPETTSQLDEELFDQGIVKFIDLQIGGFCQRLEILNQLLHSWSEDFAKSGSLFFRAVEIRHTDPAERKQIPVCPSGANKKLA